MWDVSSFKERFKLWKLGVPVYKDGRPIDYSDDKEEEMPSYVGGKPPKRGFHPTARQLRTIEYVISRLRQAGFNDIDIAGILANAKTESSFDPASVNSSDHRGLWQNETARHLSVKKLYGDHSLKSLVDYLIDWANRDIKKLGYTLGSHGKYGTYKKGTYSNPRESAYWFEKTYERSGGLALGKRLREAEDIYEWIKGYKPGEANPTYIERPAEIVHTHSKPKVIEPIVRDESFIKDINPNYTPLVPNQLQSYGQLIPTKIDIVPGRKIGLDPNTYL